MRNVEEMRKELEEVEKQIEELESKRYSLSNELSDMESKLKQKKTEEFLEQKIRDSGDVCEISFAELFEFDNHLSFNQLINLAEEKAELYGWKLEYYGTDIDKDLHSVHMFDPPTTTWHPFEPSEGTTNIRITK